MSGHSKWATIHRQKETKDAKRGQVFTKLTNAITCAVRASGGITDPEKNFKLRLIVEKARAFNMPKENIQRAIGRGIDTTGGEGWEEVSYEGYGPAGIAVVVEAMTNNKNRTTAEIKNLFERMGGSLVGPGAVSFQFQKAGLLTLPKNNNPANQILAIMDLGVEDIEEAADAVEVYTKPEELTKVKEKLLAAGFAVSQMEQILKPKTTVPVGDKETAEKILKFMETIEAQDDIQQVFANFDISDEVLAKLSVQKA